MEENRDIRGLLQEQFANFEAEPGVDLWAGIEAELHTAPPPKRLWIPWVSIAASIALIVGLFWILIPKQSGTDGETIAATPSIAVPIESAQEQSANLQGEKEIEPLAETNPQEVEATISVIHQAVEASSSIANNVVLPSVEAPVVDPSNEDAPRRRLTPINPLAQAPWKNPEIQKVDVDAMPNVLVANQPRSANNESSTSREVIRKKNNIDFNDLTLGQAIAFASNEISKLRNSPVEVRHEAGPNEQVSQYEVNFLNVHLASNETTKTSAQADQPLAASEPVEEINTFQFDLFNFRIKKKTHKRVINKRKS